MTETGVTLQRYICGIKIGASHTQILRIRTCTAEIKKNNNNKTEELLYL
jgi:hypothetical protein